MKDHWAIEQAHTTDTSALRQQVARMESTWMERALRPDMIHCFSDRVVEMMKDELYIRDAETRGGWDLRRP